MLILSYFLANTGAVFMGLIWFFSYAPYFFIVQRYEDLSFGLKMASCLLPNTAMSMGAYLIGLFEGTGVETRSAWKWDPLTNRSLTATKKHN